MEHRRSLVGGWRTAANTTPTALENSDGEDVDKNDYQGNGYEALIRHRQPSYQHQDSPGRRVEEANPVMIDPERRKRAHTVRVGLSVAPAAAIRDQEMVPASGIARNRRS